MDKSMVSVRLDDAVGLLRTAQDFKWPYVLTVDGIRTIVNREQFLEFYIDVTIEDLWDLKETVDGS
ncbi:hypothetical protein D3C74_368480 [compost metagenome]